MAERGGKYGRRRGGRGGGLLMDSEKFAYGRKWSSADGKKAKLAKTTNVLQSLAAEQRC